MAKVVVRRGRAKPLWRGHPWVYRDSIARIEGAVEAGDLVAVHDEGGRALGSGFHSPESLIAVRILSRDEHVEADLDFFAERIRNAVHLRRETLQLPVVTDACRLVHAEGDRLPGLVVDQFGDCLVVQFSTVGMHRRRETILDALERVLEPRAIYEQADRWASEREGLPARTGLLRGAPLEEPPTILENGVCFRVGIQTGQKTGFFTDQRDNRAFLGRLVRERSVLDLHTYTGGFALYAATSGAGNVTGIDTSGAALALAAENAMLNHVRHVRFERADARAFLNQAHRAGNRFDIVVSDPPKFARERSGLARALRAYRDLHLRALRVVAPGGLIAASSCSGLVEEAAFLRTLREAAYDLGRPVQVLHIGGQAPDHPVLVTCPESRYLKFVVAAVG